MKKKLIIGCIIAVVILVLVSFTGVVGYQTTKSNSVKVSPLFNIRTNRAIDEESKDLTCKYVGKGNTLPFPERDDKTIMIQKAIDSISKMDDKTFDRFIAYIINYAQKNGKINGISPDEIREALYLFRNSDESIPIFDANTNNNPQILTLMTCYITCSCIITFDYGFKGFLGCLLVLPFLVVLTIYFILVGMISTIV
ncbi:MAG: hypothetical protein JSW06_09240 [Thermoplasmatales archaeon]|nr:MAG: hypothetical protein JSW06_09240 [Thermoplasmatales archaeon]